MSYSDPTKLFNVLREREKAVVSGSFGNKNLMKLQKGKAYAVRLLWLPSEEREYPMINQYVHHFWDDNAVGSKDISVICPTSQYDLGETKEGFGSCPICAKTSELYKESQAGSKSAEEMYRKFKRTLKGYVPVYVVSGPEEDKHKVRIMPYTISFKRYFDEKIFGIKKQDKNAEQNDVEETNMIGIDAFMYYNPKSNEVVTVGHNLLISVDTKRVPMGQRMVDMPDYKFEFSMKKTDITDFDGVEITPEYFKNLSNELKFDEDFYKMSSKEDLQAFYRKNIDCDVSFDSDDVHKNSADDEIDMLSRIVEREKKVAESKPAEAEEDELDAFMKGTTNESIEEKPEKKKPVSKAKPEKEEKKIDEIFEEEPEKTDAEEDDELDIDDLLGDII